MPRRSAASFDTPSAPAPSSRLAPPAGMARDEAALFAELVTTSRPGHFQQCDTPLLAAFVRASLIERASAAEVRRLLAEAPRSLLDAHMSAVKALHLLSMRLRLSPQARQPHLSRESNTRPEPTNIYDKMRAERAGNGSKHL